MSSSVADPSSQQQQQQASKVCLYNLLLALFVSRVKSSKLCSSSFEILLVQSCSLSLSLVDVFMMMNQPTPQPV
jgi:hypothetical protein